jgi:hypothetical protein
MSPPLAVAAEAEAAQRLSEGRSHSWREIKIGHMGFPNDSGHLPLLPQESLLSHSLT